MTPPEPARVSRVALAAILVAAAAIQSAALLVPITGARDTQSAAIARHLREDGAAGILHPRGPFSADGRGEALMEFPLVGAMGAVVETLLPPLGEAAYRLPSMAFAALAVASIFALVRRRLGDTAALAAAALAAFAPVHLEIAAAPRPDEAAFALTVFSLALLDRGRMTASAIALSLSFLAKTTYAIALVAWVVLLARRDGWRALLRPRALAALAIALVPIALWQLRAERVNAASPLMGSLTVGESVADYLWQKGRIGLFLAPRWYAGIGARLAALATVGGSILALGGAAAIVARRDRRAAALDLALALLGALAALLVLFPWHSYDHPYYVLPALPLTALLGGIAVGEVRAFAARRAPAAAAAALAALLTAAAAAPELPRAVRRLRVHGSGAVAFGDAVRRLVPAGERIVVAAPFIGPWDGSLLYRADRDGWRYSTTTLDESNPEHAARLDAARRERGEFLDPRRTVPFSLSREHALDPPEIERLRARGAAFFAYAGPLERLRADRPDLAAHLEATARLVESTPSLTLFSL